MAEILTLCGQIIDSRYQVEACIAEGGMGSVWRVRHLRTLQCFALKTLHATNASDSKAKRRFLQEARITASLQSTHVVRIVDVRADYVHDGVSLPYLVMELVEGPSLARVLESRGAIDPSELCWLLRQVCDALSLAHASGVVHRDLKPSNILISADVNGKIAVKLCDFGIAKLRGHQRIDGGDTHLSTEAGSMLGTPRYMAPEQLIKGGVAVPATDQWALAMTAYRCLAGHDYFGSARNGVELVLAIVHDSLPAPSQLMPTLPPEFDAWFMRSCARATDARFPGVLAQLDALCVALQNPEPTLLELGTLDDALDDVGLEPAKLTQSNAAGSPAPVLGWRRRRSFPLTAGAAILAVLGTNWMSGHLIHGSAAAPAPSPAASEPPSPGSVPAVSGNSVPIELDALVVDGGPVRVQNDSELDGSTAQKERALQQNKRARMPSKRSPNGSRPSRLLPFGAACSRSAQCANGICLAEVCQ